MYASVMEIERSPTYDRNMSAVETRNRVRRMNLSTMKNATKPVENNDQIARTALIKVWVPSEVYPIESKSK
jgi:hypothetical protein